MKSRSPALVAFVAIVGLPTLARAVDFTPNHLFVSNNAGSIFEFAQDGSFVRAITMTGATPLVNGMSFNADGVLLVADTGDDQIFAVNADGTNASLFTTADMPTDVVLGPGGEHYVSVITNNRVKVYSPAGVFARDVGAGTSINKPPAFELGPDGHVYCESGNASQIRIFELDQAGPSIRTIAPAGTFNAGHGMSFGKNGEFLIAGCEANLVTRFDKVGVKVGTFGNGTPFTDPEDVLIGPNGNLFITYQTGTGQGLVGEFGFDNVKVRDIGNGFGVTFASRAVFAPFRFLVKLTGNIKRGDGASKVPVEEEAILSISPNSGVVLIKLTNYPADDLVTVLGRDTLVFHGSEFAKSATDPKHTFNGADVPIDARLNGYAALALEMTDVVDGATGFARVKKFTGTLTGTGPTGGFSVKVKSKGIAVSP